MSSAILVYSNLLPVEIWRECFQYLNIDDHKNLLLTCHLFHDIALPFAFNSISCSSELELYKDKSENYEDYLETTRRNTEGIRTLSKNTRYTPHVRRINLRCSLRLSKFVDQSLAKTAKELHKSFIAALLSSLPAFANIREVDLRSDEPIKMPMLTALQALPRLESLSFMQVKFAIHKLQQRLELNELSIEVSHARESDSKSAEKSLDLFSGDRLKRLSLKSEVYAPKVFVSLGQQGVLVHLVDLSVKVKSTDISTLYHFLEFCPNLKVICIRVNWGLPILPDSLPELPASALPLLKSVKFPHYLLKTFLRGRPVDTICLDDGLSNKTLFDLQRIVNIFALSTAKVIDLDLGVDFDHRMFAYLVVSLPRLIRLKCRSSFTNGALVSQEDYDRFTIQCAASADRAPLRISHKLKLPNISKDNAKYLDILHYIAVMRQPLLGAIKELHLFNFLVSNFSTGCLPPKGELGEATEDVVHCRGRVYTAEMVHTIFMLLSARYANLERVVVTQSLTEFNDHIDVELTWMKEDNKRWTWFGWKY